MKLNILLAVVVLVTLLACNNATGKKVELKTYKDSLSYAVGVQVGSSLTRDSLDIDVSVLSAAIQNRLDNDTTVMSMDAVVKVFNDLRGRMQKKQMEAQQKVGADNKAKGDAFLAENKKKDGVKTTESGLQYKVLKAGTGKQPKDGDKVTVHYHGTLIDGTVFDSSVERGKPIDFGVNGVIPGWTEALKLMKEGAKFKLFIPSDLAYGARGSGAKIGPNVALIFEVELIKVQ